MKKKKNFWTVALILAALIGLVVTMGGCLPTTPGGPEADFRADVTSGATPLTVQFTDLSSPGASPITSWHWLFGDGAKGTSAEQNPVHTYDAAGTYNVSLAVTTANGEDTELKLNFISITPSGEGEGEGEGDSEGEREGKTQTILLPGDVPLEMVWIPAGTFMMGRHASEIAHSDENPEHSVTFSSGFWMGKYELTKAQWTAVMGTTPWPGLSYVDDPNSPVCMSWKNAQAFITALNTYTVKTFRLPSEAEWEYACRAGTTTMFYWGDDKLSYDGRGFMQIGSYAWYDDNSYKYMAGRACAHIVGLKLPNAWGLYDMSGNVLELCQDLYHLDYTGAPTDGSAWESPTDLITDLFRVIRGGSWNEGDYCCRSTRRVSITPDSAFNSVGFRVVRTP